MKWISSIFRRQQSLSTGAAAEDAARAYLLKKGYQEITRNYRTRSGEVDLIMREGDCLVFVEVRARSRSDFGRAEETVTPAKQNKIFKAALSFLKAERLVNKPLRFDVVAVDPEGIHHIPNAFQPSSSTYYY